MNRAMMSRAMRIESPHDVNISFWPASGASVGALEWGGIGRRIGEGTDHRGLRRLSLALAKSQHVFIRGVSSITGAHTQELGDSPPYCGGHVGLSSKLRYIMDDVCSLREMVAQRIGGSGRRATQGCDQAAAYVSWVQRATRRDRQGRSRGPVFVSDCARSGYVSSYTKGRAAARWCGFGVWVLLLSCDSSLFRPRSRRTSRDATLSYCG